MMTRANLLVVTVIISMLCSCVTSTTQTRQFEESDEAAGHNYQLGLQYFRKGNYILARDRLIRSLDFEPKTASTHSMLALTYVQLSNKRLASKHFDLAIRYGPNDQDVRNTYAVFLCGQGNYDEARKQFDRAINIRENDNPEVMMSNAGVCMAKKPDLELAERYFRQAIARRPSYGEALIQLAALKHRTEDNLTARAFLQRYLSFNEASAAVLYLAIQIETQLGMDREATDYLNLLLRDFPDSPEARQTLTSSD